MKASSKSYRKFLEINWGRYTARAKLRVGKVRRRRRDRKTVREDVRGWPMANTPGLVQPWTVNATRSPLTCHLRYPEHFLVCCRYLEYEFPPTTITRILHGRVELRPDSKKISSSSLFPVRPDLLKKLVLKLIGI